MTVRRDINFNNKWVVDFIYQHANGHRQRIRKVSPVQTKRESETYERQIRQELLEGTYMKKQKEVPTFHEFAKDFLETYARSSNKPSEYAAKQTIITCHLDPALGKAKLDCINTHDIDRLKGKKIAEGLSPKTVNNILTVLRRMLAIAKEWELIGDIPLIKWLKVSPQKFDFLSFEEAQQLLEASQEEPTWCAMILLFQQS
jgi:integrase